MRKYIVSVDFEVGANSAEGALEEMQIVIGDAIELLSDAKMGERALILERCVYAEPYSFNESGCMYDHDHSRGGCETHN